MLCLSFVEALLGEGSNIDKIIFVRELLNVARESRGVETCSLFATDKAYVCSKLLRERPSEKDMLARGGNRSDTVLPLQYTRSVLFMAIWRRSEERKPAGSRVLLGDVR